MKKMNLPNKLTILRIVLVPFVMAAILIEFPLHFLAAGLIFGAAAITDAFDGRIARRDNLITDFGKFADPLADKILVISVLVCFVKLGLCGAVPLCIIIFREFAVTSVRLVAAANGKVIAANMWGKVKTVSQIVAIVAIFVMQLTVEIISRICVGWEVPLRQLSSGEIVYSYTGYIPIFHAFEIFNVIGQILLWITAVITVISGVKYLIDNKDVISDM
jgi:CDP-diacylglycerol--glycerol-3-phosphate 3-phosphatidyltransferase